MNDEFLQDAKDAIEMVNVVAKTIEHMSSRSRISLLCSLLAEDICMRSYSERQECLIDVLGFLPVAVRQMEKEMRDEIAENARGEE
jgi:hypothetical protein